MGEPVMPPLAAEVTPERTVLVPVIAAVEQGDFLPAWMVERPDPRRATFALVQRGKTIWPLEGAAFP
jgi:hypothetical protein